MSRNHENAVYKAKINSFKSSRSIYLLLAENLCTAIVSESYQRYFFLEGKYFNDNFKASWGTICV